MAAFGVKSEYFNPNLQMTKTHFFKRESLYGAPRNILTRRLQPKKGYTKLIPGTGEWKPISQEEFNKSIHSMSDLRAREAKEESRIFEEVSRATT